MPKVAASECPRVPDTTADPAKISEAVASKFIVNSTNGLDFEIESIQKIL